VAAVRKLRIDMPDCARPLAAPTAASANDRAAASLAPHAERGPFRPEVWRNARQRSTVRLAAYYFRAADVLAVVGLAVVALWSLGSMALRHPAASVGKQSPRTYQMINLHGCNLI